MKYKVHFADDIELMLRGDNKLKDVTSSLTGWRTETNIAKESHVNTNGVVNGEELQEISSFNNLSVNLSKMTASQQKSVPGSATATMAGLSRD